MQRVQLEGTPRQMGEAFGEGFRREVAELYALRRDNALAQARQYGGRTVAEGDLLGLAARCMPVCLAFDAEGHEELLGIAHGAGLGPEQVMALNGLTDLRDVLAWGGDPEQMDGCTAFVVQGDRTEDGAVRIGQTWDLGTANRPFVVSVHRRPREGPETWTVTTAGALSLMGISETGVAIGTTNLRTRDARVGVPYLQLIHRALRCEDAREAVLCIAGAPRAGAHSFVVADRSGAGVVLECTATLAHERWVRTGFDVQTNHCQHPPHRALEAATPVASSRARLSRMRSLLAAPGILDDARLISCLADREGGGLSINRDDVDGISTNAAFVAAPCDGSLRACAGAPDAGPWASLGPGRPAQARRRGAR